MRKRFEYLVGAYGPTVARFLIPGPLWIGPHNRGEKVLYLTFDDGPTPHVTPGLLDVMSDFGVHAMFFLLGRQVDAFPDLTAEIFRRGHSVGVHGYAHLDAWRADAKAVEDDLRRSVSVIRGFDGRRIRYYRPPFGRFTRSSARLANELGLEIVMWSIMPGDYLPGVESGQIASRVRRRRSPGSIIVLHDSGNVNVRQHTAPAVRQIIKSALEDGWSFGTLPS